MSWSLLVLSAVAACSQAPASKEQGANPSAFAVNDAVRARIAAILSAARNVTPATYASRYEAAVQLEQLVREDATISAVDADTAYTVGLVLIEEALALKPPTPEALMYKSILLRGKGRVATDPAIAASLTAAADVFKAEALAARQKP